MRMKMGIIGKIKELLERIICKFNKSIMHSSLLLLYSDQLNKAHLLSRHRSATVHVSSAQLHHKYIYTLRLLSNNSLTTVQIHSSRYIQVIPSTD